MNKLPALPRLINSQKVPKLIRDIFRKSEESDTNEQDLWKVCVAIAVLDACDEIIA